MGVMVMADEQKSPKTETLGYVPASRAKELKGWAHYEKAAKDLTAAREASTAAKKVIRDQLKASFGEAVDFNVDGEGRLQVFRNLEKTTRRPRGKDLSAELFR
jgi:hypothetical protein